MHATPIPDSYALEHRRLVFAPAGTDPTDPTIQPVEGLIVPTLLAGKPWNFAWFRFALTPDDLTHLEHDPTIWAAITAFEAGILPFAVTTDPPT